MSRRAPLWLIVDDTQICPEDLEDLLSRDPELVLASCFTYGNSSQWSFTRDPTFFVFAGGSSDHMSGGLARKHVKDSTGASSFGTNTLGHMPAGMIVDFELFFIGELNNHGSHVAACIKEVKIASQELPPTYLYSAGGFTTSAARMAPRMLRTS